MCVSVYIRIHMYLKVLHMYVRVRVYIHTYLKVLVGERCNSYRLLQNLKTNHRHIQE